MRRIQFSSYSYLPAVGGVERVTNDLASAFAAAGYRPHLVTNTHPEKPRGLVFESGFPVLRVHVPPWFDRPPEDAFRYYWWDLLNIVARAAAALFFRVEAIHMHHLNVDAIYCLWLQRWLRFPFVVSLHGGETDLWIANNPQRIPFLRRVLESADAVTAVSRTLLERARTLAPALDANAVVIRNPIDVDALRRLADSARAPLPPTRDGWKRVVCIGQLVPWKAVEVAIDAFHTLRRNGTDSNVELVIVGDGPERAKLEGLAAGGEAREDIVFTGALPHDETLAVLRVSDALCLVSTTEGCPKVVLEARTFGIPVIVSDAPSLLELVTDGVDGLVVRRSDAAGLARALLHLFEDPGLACRIAAAGAERLDEHRIEYVLARYAEVYESLPTRSTPGPSMAQSDRDQASMAVFRKSV